MKLIVWCTRTRSSTCTTRRDFLKSGLLLHIFSVPNLFALVNDGQPSLHFEHTILLREEHIQWLLESKGFEIVTKQYFGGTHSIFYNKSRGAQDKWPASQLLSRKQARLPALAPAHLRGRCGV